MRGVRIELGEVEKHIIDHPAVEVAAAAVDATGSETVLTAYVVPMPGQALTERELRGFLRKKLPQSMIPAEFLFVDALPLSANGKIDRKNLRLLRQVAPATEQPRDEVERRIAEIWKKLLKDDQFGVRDDFFDCGGDSLLSVQLLMQLEREFKTRVSLDTVLDTFTIEEIAKLIREVTAQPSPASLEPARPRAAPRGDVICRIAELDDIPGIWGVCRRAFAPYADASLEDFRALCEHRWLNNPLRTADDPFGWVLETAAGEIVGFHGLVPVRLWIGGQGLGAVSPTTWAADPGHGRAGLTMLSAYMNWGRDRFLLNTTANATTSAMHEGGSYGMRKIPVPNYDQRLLWVLDFQALVRWKVGHSKISGGLRRAATSRLGLTLLGAAAPLALGAAGGVRTALRASLRPMRIKFGDKPLQVEPVTHFGAEFDALWDRAKRQYDVTMERSAKLLNWRHLNLPRLLGTGHAFACRDQGERLGYIAMREPTTTAPGHFIVTDLFYDTGRPEVLHNLMDAAFDCAAARSASALEIFGFHSALNRELRRQHPYVLQRSQMERLGRGVSLRGILGALDPRRRDVPSSTYWYRAQTAELDAICATGRWWPSGIDGDLNL